jgi:hypothetical protein
VIGAQGLVNGSINIPELGLCFQAKALLGCKHVAAALE